MEFWIVLLVAVAGLSGWAGYFWASRNAPKRSELEALAAELDQARRSADSVQANVDEHFEQSARLFGKLAGDYREFLEHFAGSAQSLGLSESRTRELVQQSFQPLLTHEVDDLVVAGTATAPPAPEAPTEPTEPTEPAEASAADAQPPRVAEVALPDTPDDGQGSHAVADEPADDDRGDSTQAPGADVRAVR